MAGSLQKTSLFLGHRILKEGPPFSAIEEIREKEEQSLSDGCLAVAVSVAGGILSPFGDR